MPTCPRHCRHPFAPVIWAVALVAAAAPLAPAELAVGWAAGDITPPRPVSLQGQRHLRVSRGVRDPLTCTALALESVAAGRATDHVVFVSCDLANVTPELLDALAEHHAGLRTRAVGLDPARIVVNATHTHTGPRVKDTGGELPDGVMRPEEYLAFAAARIAAAVEEAWNGRRPGAASWALAHAAVAHNRRVEYLDPATGRPAAGRTTMYGRTAVADFDAIEGPADSGMPLVCLRRPDGSLTGVIVNLSCPAQETEQLEEVSADFWHEARQELRKALGPDVFVLPQCGAAGDCTSRAVWRTAAEQEMLRRRGGDARREIARRIAAAVADVLPVAAADTDADPVLAHAIRTIDLPQRIVTPEERETSRAAAAAAKTPEAAHWHGRVAARFAEQEAALARGEPTVVPVTVHAVRLGDVAFVTNPFELYGDYGVRIQARSPATLTAVVQLAGRGTAGTYLPTARAVAGAGYSAIVESNLVGPAGGRRLVDESVALVESLWARPTAAAARRESVVEPATAPATSH